MIMKSKDITWAVDETELGESHYFAGRDMRWTNVSEFDKKSEAIRYADKLVRDGQAGVRVDRLNNNDEAIAAVQTVYTVFQGGTGKHYKLVMNN